MKRSIIKNNGYGLDFLHDRRDRSFGNLGNLLLHRVGARLLLILLKKRSLPIASKLRFVLCEKFYLCALHKKTQVEHCQPKKWGVFLLLHRPISQMTKKGKVQYENIHTCLPVFVLNLRTNLAILNLRQ